MVSDRPDIKDLARWRWREILEAEGVPSNLLVNRGVPCPICNGKDRFRFDDKEGTGSSYCNQCGARSGIGLLMALKDMPFIEAVKLVEKYVGNEPTKDPFSDRNQTKRDPKETNARLVRTWKGAKPIIPGTPAYLYLMRRVGYVPSAQDLRFHPYLRHPEDGEYYPCLLGRLARGKEGIGLHRTFLTVDGYKAHVGKQKMLMPSVKGYNGSSVKLYDGTPDEIGVAEGIETSLAAAMLFKAPFHAATNANLVRTFMPPSHAKRIIIAADADESYTGQSEAFVLARTLKAKGLIVSVEVPPIGKDWNDVLNETRKAS